MSAPSPFCGGCCHAEVWLGPALNACKLDYRSGDAKLKHRLQSASPAPQNERFWPAAQDHVRDRACKTRYLGARFLASVARSAIVGWRVMTETTHRSALSGATVWIGIATVTSISLLSFAREA